MQIAFESVVVVVVVVIILLNVRFPPPPPAHHPKRDHDPLHDGGKAKPSRHARANVWELDWSPLGVLLVPGTLTQTLANLTPVAICRQD